MQTAGGTGASGVLRGGDRVRSHGPHHSQPGEGEAADPGRGQPPRVPRHLPRLPPVHRVHAPQTQMALSAHDALLALRHLLLSLLHRLRRTG